MYQATIRLPFSFQTKGMYNVYRDSEMRKVENLENQFVLIFFHSGLNNRHLALLFGVFIRFLVLFLQWQKMRWCYCMNTFRMSVESLSHLGIK